MENQSVHMIAAIQECDRGLGYTGELLYTIGEDMQHFKTLTTGTTVIMGQKTWESLPEKFRPLPNRTNIVMTRDSAFSAPGAIIVHSPAEALSEASHHDRDIYVIGGGQIYTLLLPFTTKLHLTLIEGNKTADAFFPEYEDDFKIISESEAKYDEKAGVGYRFCELVRKN